MSYSMNRRHLGQTPPPTPSVEERRGLPPLANAALMIGVLIFVFNMYAKDTEQEAYSED